MQGNNRNNTLPIQITSESLSFAKKVELQRLTSETDHKVSNTNNQERNLTNRIVGKSVPLQFQTAAFTSEKTKQKGGREVHLGQRGRGGDGDMKKRLS